MEKTLEKKTWLERFAESQNLVFCGLAIMLMPFMIHTATLLLSVSIVKWKVYAYFFAFGFDLAIFIFAAHGRRTAAGGIAIIVFLMNVSVLNLDTMNQKFDPLLVKFLITAVLSGTGAWILHSYVVMFNEKKEQRDQTVEFYDKQAELHGIIDELEQKNKKLVSEVASVNEKLRALEIEKLVAAKATENSTKTHPDNEEYLEIGSNIICKACAASFEGKAGYESYKKSGLCTKSGCQTKKEEIGNSLMSTTG